MQHRQAKKVFSENLREALARANVTQSELARRTGLSRDAISTYVNERSLPATDSLRKIARVLRTDAITLLPEKFLADSVNTLAITADGDGWVLEVKVRLSNGEVLNKVVDLLRPYVDVPAP